MEINKDEVGFRISTIRKRLGLNQELFGKKINQAHKSLVSKWEKGQSLPNNERLKIIAELGEISVDELLYGSFKNRVIKLINDYIKDYSPHVSALEYDNRLDAVLNDVLNYIIARDFFKDLEDDKLKAIIDRQVSNEFMRGKHTNEKAISYFADYLTSEVTKELYEYFYTTNKEGKMALRTNMSKDLHDLLYEKLESFSEELRDLEYEIFGDI